MAQADELKAQGDAALLAAQAAITEAQAAIDGLHALAITPPPALDVTTLPEEELIALDDQIQAERNKRLREQN